MARHPLDFSYITDKWYKTSEERDELIRGTADLMSEFMEGMMELIMQLQMLEYRFLVFYMDTEAKPATLHAGLVYCCGERKGQPVDLKFRQEIVEPVIFQKTRYKRVVWEI